MNRYTMRIDKLRRDRGWSVYKLAQESGLSAPTIHQWLETETVPTLFALEQICDALKITLADFFATNTVNVTPQIKELYDKWLALSVDEKKSVELIINNYATLKRT